MWHRTDPQAPRRAIPALAQLVEQGLLGAESAAATLTAVPAPGADPSGWAARRAWALADARADWARARQRAAWALHTTLAPLLAGRAPRATLEQAAAAADPRGAFTPAQRAELLRLAVARALAGARQPA